MFIFDSPLISKSDMKKSSFFVLVFIFCISISSNVFALNFNSLSEKDKVEIVISRRTTKVELETMIKNLKKEGVDISITDVTYSGKGTVRKITGEINFNDGHSGVFQATRLKTIRIVRDYSPEAEKPFDIIFEN
jgi:hypothetical protein